MHTKYTLILIALLMSIHGCEFFREPGKAKCDKIIGREKMAALLGDVYLLEAFLQEVNMRSPDIEDSILFYYNGLFDKHAVSRWEFQEALSCYLLYENEMQQIHDIIMQRFSILESAATALRDSTLMAEEAARLASLKGLSDTISHDFRFERLYQWWPAVADFSVPFIVAPTIFHFDSLNAEAGKPDILAHDSLLEIIDLPNNP